MLSKKTSFWSPVYDTRTTCSHLRHVTNKKDNDLYSIFDSASVFSILFTDNYDKELLTAYQQEHVINHTVNFSGSNRFVQLQFYPMFFNSSNGLWPWENQVPFSFAYLKKYENKFYYVAMMSKYDFIKYAGILTIDSRCVAIIGTNLVEKVLLNVITREVKYLRSNFENAFHIAPTMIHDCLAGVVHVKPKPNVLKKLQPIREITLQDHENMITSLYIIKSYKNNHIARCFGQLIGITINISNDPTNYRFIIDTANIGCTLIKSTLNYFNSGAYTNLSMDLYVRADELHSECLNEHNRLTGEFSMMKKIDNFFCCMSDYAVKWYLSHNYVSHEIFEYQKKLGKIQKIVVNQALEYHVDGLLPKNSKTTKISKPRRSLPHVSKLSSSVKLEIDEYKLTNVANVNIHNDDDTKNIVNTLWFDGNLAATDLTQLTTEFLLLDFITGRIFSFN